MDILAFVLFRGRSRSHLIHPASVQVVHVKRLSYTVISSEDRGEKLKMQVESCFFFFFYREEVLLNAQK